MRYVVYRVWLRVYRHWLGSCLVDRHSDNKTLTGLLICVETGDGGNDFPSQAGLFKAAFHEEVQGCQNIVTTDKFSVKSHPAYRLQRCPLIHLATILYEHMDVKIAIDFKQRAC